MKVQLAYVAAAAALLGFAPVQAPHARTSAFVAVAAGAAIGAAAYFLLARHSVAVDRQLLVPAIGAAFGEEIVWRWGALAGLAPLVGWPGAFGASTVAFAYRHTRNEGLVVYLVLGAAFGGALLATGRLAAAIAAHATYNALVVLVPR